MTMMRYVLKNIHALVKNEKFIFAVMLVCVFASAWVMIFSYGLYHNYQEMLNQSDEFDNDFDLSLADGEILTRGELTRYISELSPNTLDAMEIIMIQGSFDPNPDIEYDNISLVSRFVVRDGEFRPSPKIVQGWTGDWELMQSGRYISDFEEANAERVVMIEGSRGTMSMSFEENYPKDKYPDLYIDDETVVLSGEEFKIIGRHLSFGAIVPFLAIPEDMSIDPPLMGFIKPVTRNQYNDMVDTAERVLPGKFVFPEVEFDEEGILIYNNMLIVAVLIAVLAIINFAFLYSFILQKRARTLAVMRICGCTKGRARRICLGECCLICIPTFLIGMLTYIPFLHGVLSKLFGYIEEAYNLTVYTLMFAIFVAVLLLEMWILLSRQIRRELAEAHKGGAI